MIAYKYCNRSGLHILESLEIKITPPNEFNDPFEFTPRVICSNPSRRIKRLFKDKAEIRNWYLEQKQQGFGDNFREFRKQLKRATPTIVEQLTPKLPEVSVEAQNEYLDHISKTYGLLCLSERPDSILMWGHYCDKYCGLVTGFDASHNAFKGPKGLRPVKYIRERVLLDASWKQGGNAEKAFTDTIIFSKNLDWGYEQELRQFFLLAGLNRRELGNGTIGYFYPIPAEAIRSVILGPRSISKLRTGVEAALNKSELSHVKLQHARLDESEFRLRLSD